MKKTLVLLLSILLIAVTFTACDNGNSGPSEEPTVDQDTAKDLATTYMGAINYGSLIVEAFEESNNALDITPEANGFTIEFDGYKGAALDTSAKEEEGATELSQIKSGALKFTFPAAKKATEAKTQYTVETVEDKPLVFVDKENKELATFEFSASGTANASFNVVGGVIVGLADGATSISITKPTEATISVGNVTVKYDDIKNDVTVNGDGAGTITPEESFTESDARDAAASIFSDLSRANLVADLMAGLKGIDNSTDDVDRVTLDEFEVLYQGKANEEIKKTIISLFKNGLSKADGLGSLTSIRDPYNLTLNMTVSFDNYDNAFKDDAKLANMIKEGTVTVSLVPGRIDTTSFELVGTYTVKTDSGLVVDTDNGDYTITLSDLAGAFTLNLTDLSKSDLMVTAKDDTAPNVTIALGKESQKLEWPALANAIAAKDTSTSKTNFAEDTAKQLDAEYFYQHFGTQRFLTSLSGAWGDNDKTEGHGISIDTKDPAVTLSEEEGADSFTLEVEFTNYLYYFGEGSQTVNGTVTFTFKGDVNDSAFTAKTFTVTSDSALNLTDKTQGGRGPASITFKDAAGTIGTAGVTFTVDESKISGITDYSGEAYVAAQHEFSLDSGFPAITIK